VASHQSIVTSALQALDPRHAANALDGAFDKRTNFNETGVMVDALVDDYPALASIVSRLPCASRRNCATTRPATSW
jgi:hypothetical protein